MDPKITDLLRRAVDSGRLSDAPEDLTTYAYDGTWAEVLPDVVVHPENTAQVAALLRIADEYRVPVVPRGSGTGLAGGAVPIEGSICLNLARMNRIKEINAADFVAVVSLPHPTQLLDVAPKSVTLAAGQLVVVQHMLDRGYRLV